MARLPLTDDQKAAATCPSIRLFIEASPGSGKTTVAAERFGVLRYGPGCDGTGPVVALSFTRSATAELRSRVTRRWGAAACSWPNRIETIDTFLRRLLEHLLRTDVLKWPGDRTELEMLDDWHGHSGFRPLQAGAWCRFMEVLEDGTIRTTARQVTEKRWGFGTVGTIAPLLSSGLSTPREVRESLTGAFAYPVFRSRTIDFLQATVGHLLVDEVFDANELDTRMLHAACVAGIPLTIIGDPWQALFGWRGATPDLIEPFVETKNFDRASLPQSFRFKSEETEQLALLLRSGSPTAPADLMVGDVVLARKWRYLWDLPGSILPLSFGRPQNQTHAALVLLLDMVTRGRLRQSALFLREALLILGIDKAQLNMDGPSVLAPLLDQLAAGEDPAAVLNLLRDAVVSIGASQRPPSGNAAKENEYCVKLQSLSVRVAAPAVVAGLTVYQAKGMEWDAVAVHLSADDRAILAGGLSKTHDAHRVLYVAFTRARFRVGSC